MNTNKLNTATVLIAIWLTCLIALMGYLTHQWTVNSQIFNGILAVILPMLICVQCFVLGNLFNLSINSFEFNSKYEELPANTVPTLVFPPISIRRYLWLLQPSTTMWIHSLTVLWCSKTAYESSLVVPTKPKVSPSWQLLSMRATLLLCVLDAVLHAATSVHLSTQSNQYQCHAIN